MPTGGGVGRGTIPSSVRTQFALSSRFITGVAKGLREPCSPRRSAYFFGAELNSVDADDWNCLPELVDQATIFDLSRIDEYQEVVVALLGIDGTSSGLQTIGFKWYSDTPRKLLYEGSFTFNAYADGWMYGYSYIGWAPWEMDHNGVYFVEIYASGRLTYQTSLGLVVSGIPEEAPEPPEGEGFMAWIIEQLGQVSSFCHAIYLEVFDWAWPLNLAARPFYELSVLFADLSWSFYDFSLWVDGVIVRLKEIITWENVEAMIRAWVEPLADVIDWIQARVNDVITLATELRELWDTFWQDIWPDWTGELETIVSEFHHFLTDTLPGLLNFDQLGAWFKGNLEEIQGLIDSAFEVRSSLWDDWQDMRGQVIEFFGDPLEWVYNRLDEFFERFW